MGPIMGRKGIINVIELSIVLIMLFVSFNVFFPGNTYRSRWEDAYAVTRARDITLTIDRTGRLHELAFSEDKMQDFLNSLFPFPDTVFWTTVSGGNRGEVKVACNCTDTAIESMRNWVRGTVLNRRNITFSFCKTKMEKVGTGRDACLDESDVLVIWGYKPLGAKFDTLSEYALRGNGIVEVMDFRDTGGANPIDSDAVQSGLFELKWEGVRTDTMLYDAFSRTPKNSTDIVYGLHKLFYHVPIPYSVEPGNTKTFAGCAYTPSRRGYIRVQGFEYAFWICDDSHIWLDDNHDRTEEQLVLARGNFSTSDKSVNFTLNYVFDSEKIAVSINRDHRFGDFLAYDVSGIPTITNVQPADDEDERVLMEARTSSAFLRFPVLISNRVGSGNLAWLADFSKGGYEDDEKTLFISMLMWGANKDSVGQEISNIRAGYMSSYINTDNYDMFEIYKFNFGVGYPS